MRNEKQMMDLIMDTALSDERVRGVYMNGSRTNNKVKRDIFQDYDIVYVVRETESFVGDDTWIDVFGERLYMQMPEKMDVLLGHEVDIRASYGYLIQLADGNRLDLHLCTLDYSIRDILSDRLCIILLDKDGALPEILPADDRERWIKKPGGDEFACCCNEFWWLMNNVGKGLWRDEIPYVMDMIDLYIRPQLIRMLSWSVGLDRGYCLSIGKSAKYLVNYLSVEEYERFLSIYPQGRADAIWDSLNDVCGLFRDISRKVAKGLGFAVNESEQHNSMLLLECTRILPKDAEEILLVRRMKKEEAMELADLWLDSNLKVHTYVPRAYWHGHYEMIPQYLSQACVFVYEDHTGIHGFAGMKENYLEGIFVKEGSRSKGIGKKLMMLCKAQESKINLYVYEKNAAAMRFYEKEGFRRVNKEIDKETGCVQWTMVWERP